MPLSPAFTATGKHFVSVQPVSNGWYWWSSHTNAPKGPAFFFRDNAAGQTTWQHNDNQQSIRPNADVAFSLYGTVTGPGRIDSLSATTIARSGYLEISGANFGGNGQVLIDGISAPIADWQSTRVVTYVPVNWRFRQNGPYSNVRPAIAPDGTVYSIDVFGHLYALAPDGTLKWLVRGAGDKGVAVGADGAVYVASESFIKAFNPDGSAKWTFVQNPRAFILLGISVGPDGNIYAVATEGMGVFSLTPAGTLRWKQPEAYRRPIVDYGEIVFGLNGSTQQLYFYANDHLRALRLDGSPVFTVGGAFGQPAVAPNGSVHSALSAYTPNGTLIWTFSDQYPYNVFSAPDIGSDGVHYFTQNLIQLYALNTNGGQRWHVTLPNTNVGGPIVDPLNTQLIVGSAETLNNAGYILSKSAQDGHELWRVDLPSEDPTVFNPATGAFGFNQTPNTRARFTPDSSTAYLITATATGDNDTSKSFVYSLNAADTPTPTATLRSTKIALATSLSGTTVTAKGRVTVTDANGTIVPGATVSATWTRPDGSTVSKSDATNKSGVAVLTTTGTRGTYRFTITDVRKTGYTFDKANSVLVQTVASK